MRIEKSIHIWLEKNNCIVIPNIGALIVQQIPAKWNSVENTLEAPHKIISFNNQIIQNDGTLAHLIGNNEKIDFHQASRLLSDWNQWCYRHLTKGEEIFFDCIGTLYMTKDGYISMKMVSTKSILETDNFGLNNVRLSSDEQKAQSRIDVYHSLHTHWKPKISLSHISIAAILCLALFVPKAITKDSISPNEANMDIRFVEPTIPPVQPTIKIMAGSFRNKTNALNVLNKLEKVAPTMFHMNENEEGLYQISSIPAFIPKEADLLTQHIQTEYHNLSLWSKKIQ
ncbi:hypothetical protein K4L44_16800 [Halosquirtibacter laminarini]|uniref:Uncharacterized protein n=1 Tax=Halosquirtibacter laminarini TaxID=3374600 RepID=A0AC61NF05_9BACT|nr:hypothetical protein K4L44_16800 [Prolixibacteraceae bacterium]